MYGYDPQLNFKLPNRYLYFFVYFFATCEPVHTISKGKMAFSFECMPHYQLPKNEVAITLHFQLCAAHYTALQMKNITRSDSIINPVTTVNTDNSVTNVGKP